MKKSISMGLRFLVCLSLSLVFLSSAMPVQAADVWGWPFPTSTTVTSGFRIPSRPNHDGVDIGANIGDPIYAPHSGTIYKVYTGCNRYGGYGSPCRNAGVCNPNHGFNPTKGEAYGFYNQGYGNGICLHTSDGYYVQFAHMSAVNSTLYEGQTIERGTLLGYVGGSGCADGKHCHYAVSTGGEFSGFLNPMNMSYIYSYDKVPYGSFDLAEGGPGSIRVAGWAKDDDTPDGALSIHVYIDGPAGVGTCIKTDVVAGNDSTDVGKHRFDTTFTTNYRGTHQIYVYAINPGEGNHNPVLTGSPKTITITDPNAEPYGTLNEAEGGLGTVHVKGWVKDADVPDAPLYVDIYVGGPAGPGVSMYRYLADKYREDQNGNYGFDVTIPVKETGTQPVYVYAINKPEGHNPEIGHGTVTIAKDTEGPVISNVQIRDISWKGYTVTCDVSDNVKVDRVAFPSWTLENDQDDIIDDWEHTALGTIDNGKVTYRVDTSVHGRQTNRVYRTHIYAYDVAGNVSSIGDIEDPELNVHVPSPISNVVVSDISDEGYTVSCDIDPDWGTDKVQFPTWTENNGQDDIVWHQGTYSNGKASCRIKTSEHNHEKNCYYITHIYAWDADDTYARVDASQNQCPQLHVYVAIRMDEPDFKLPAALTVIEEGAFEGLAMEVVRCPETLTEINARAFADCTQLRQIYIPESTETIADNAFAGCPGNLTIFGVEGSQAENYADRNGILFIVSQE